MDAKEIIARRVAQELRDRTLVNLGIGLPTLVARYVPEGMLVAFQSENGIIGFGARPPEGMEDPNLTDAGGGFITAIPGAFAFDSATSFALVRGGLTTVIIAIMIPAIPQVVRLVRARVIAAREETYVDAAVLLGTRPGKLIRKHLLPTTIAPLIVQGTYMYASAILTEAALSFLGVGIGTEVPSWGNIMAEGRLYFAINPWLVFWPAIVLSLCILSINLLGDALRDRLDPKMQGRAP